MLIRALVTVTVTLLMQRSAIAEAEAEAGVEATEVVAEATKVAEAIIEATVLDLNLGDLVSLLEKQQQQQRQQQQHQHRTRDIHLLPKSVRARSRRCPPMNMKRTVCSMDRQLRVRI